VVVVVTTRAVVVGGVLVVDGALVRLPSWVRTPVLAAPTTAMETTTSAGREIAPSPGRRPGPAPQPARRARPGS
jgi:hypothetical protein